jgi:hypothetical protein
MRQIAATNEQIDRIKQGEQPKDIFGDWGGCVEALIARIEEEKEKTALAAEFTERNWQEANRLSVLNDSLMDALEYYRNLYPDEDKKTPLDELRTASMQKLWRDNFAEIED